MLIRALQDIRIHIIWCVLNEIYTRKEQEGTKGYRTQCKPPIAVRAAAEAAGVGGEGRTVVVRVADIAKHCIFMPATTLVDK